MPSRFENLNNSNYHTWSFYMEAYLGTHKDDLWTVISLEKEKRPAPGDEGYSAWWTRARKAILEISQRIEPDQIAYVRGQTDPKDVWEKLKDVHQRKGWSSMIRVRSQFITTVKTQEVTMKAHIGKLKDLSTRLTAMGETVDDRDLAIVIMSSLPWENYGTIIQMLETEMPETIKLVRVEERLLAEGDRIDRAEDGSADGGDPHGGGRDVLTARSKSRSKASQAPKCWRCNQRGHLRDKCPELSSSDEEGSSDGEPKGKPQKSKGKEKEKEKVHGQLAVAKKIRSF